MPCDDTSSRITVWIDHEDVLWDYDFNKITCNRTIGPSLYKEYCRGQHCDDVLGIDFRELVDQAKVEGEEEQFFTYLEWDAVRTSILQYRGDVDEIDMTRYQLLSILHDEEGVAITQVFQPASHMPKNIPCCHSVALKEARQS